MICPTCKHHMFVVEFQQIELDYCGNCHGVWFDQGELELLLAKVMHGDGAKPVINSVLQIEDAASDEKRRRCPICRRTMKKVNVAGDKHVLIDACVQQDGLWFDGGEVDHLIQFLEGNSPEHSGHSHVFNFIKEVFKADS